MQMLDRDLEEAAEQQTVASMSHKQNLDRLQHIQTLRLEALKEEFGESVDSLAEEYRIGREALQEQHNRDKRELKLIIEQVDQEEKEREQRETTEFQSMHEVTRNKNIEEDHQMRSQLEEKMAHLQQELEMQWQAYTSATERNTADFKSHQMRDKHCTKQVEKQKKQKT